MVDSDNRDWEPKPELKPFKQKAGEQEVQPAKYLYIWIYNNLDQICYVEFLLKLKKNSSWTCVELCGPDKENGGILVWAWHLVSASHYRVEYRRPVAALCCWTDRCGTESNRAASTELMPRPGDSHDVFIAWWLAEVGHIHVSICPVCFHEFRNIVNN